MLGEVSPGGVGVGLSGLLIMAILSVFIAGLMVGRTPEYLGKKIQAAEMKMVALYVLAMPTAVLGFAAASMFVGSVKDTTIWNPGAARPHRDPLRLHVGGQQQRVGVRRHHRRHRLDGHHARPRHARSGASSSSSRCSASPAPWPASRSCRRPPGTFPTHTPLFVGLVIGVVVIVGGLTFFPALALGPIVEHLSL